MPEEFELKGEVAYEPAAIIAMKREIAGTGANETGGVMLGTERDGIFRVQTVSGPGKNAVLSPDFFSFDVEHINTVMREAKQGNPAIGYLGYWHKHPSWCPWPSDLDLSTFVGVMTKYPDLPSVLITIATVQANGIELFSYLMNRTLHHVPLSAQHFELGSDPGEQWTARTGRGGRWRVLSPLGELELTLSTSRRTSKITVSYPNDPPRSLPEILTGISRAMASPTVPASKSASGVTGSSSLLSSDAWWRSSKRQESLQQVLSSLRRFCESHSDASSRCFVKGRSLVAEITIGGQRLAVIGLPFGDGFPSAPPYLNFPPPPRIVEEWGPSSSVADVLERLFEKRDSRGGPADAG